MVKCAILIKFDQRVLVTKISVLKIYTCNKVDDQNKYMKLSSYATHKDNIYYLFICRLSASQEENPLEFEDIVNKKTYDKMRPPKPDGILLFSFIL